MRNLRRKSAEITVAHGNQLRIRAKSKRARIDQAYTALRARNLLLEAFTTSAGEGEEERRGWARGEEEKGVRGHRALLGCSSARVRWSVAPASPLSLMHLSWSRSCISTWVLLY